MRTAPGCCFSERRPLAGCPEGISPSVRERDAAATWFTLLATFMSAR